MTEKPKTLGESLLGDIQGIGGLFEGITKTAKKVSKALAQDDGEAPEEGNEDGDEE